MSQKHLAAVGGYVREHWRKVALLTCAAFVGVMIILQMVLVPWGGPPLYTTIDTVAVGGKSSSEATKQLDTVYAKMKIPVYFGTNSKPYRQPVAGDIGLKISSEKQIAAAAYSWWLRFVPTSLWWAHLVTPTKSSPEYSRNAAVAKDYVTKELGQSCDVKAANASLEYKDKRLQVISAIDGGTCKVDDVQKLIAQATPTLAKNSLRMAIEEHPAKLHDDDAQTYAKQITDQTKDGVAIAANGQQVNVPQQELLSWLDFTAPDSGIVATVNADKSKGFFDKQLLPKVAVAPGTSKVTTLDFTEISRVDGPAGRTLDTAATIASLNKWLTDDSTKPTAQTKAVAPNVAYTRTYTPTDAGMQALITQFTQGRPGTFGVSFAELDGKRRHAAFQEAKIFRTASTYKLFVAYGALKRVEAGSWQWSDLVHGGRNLTKCLDDMIVKSDNACGEAMLAKIGYKTLTNELSAIGLKKSSFMHDVPETTAGDLTAFVGALQAGQLLNPSSTSTLLSAMKRNVFRQGIPAGASGQTADKVGFLDGLLHDAAIVYSPSGTYALTIMSDGSSWATLAELTRQIEALRSQG